MAGESVNTSNRYGCPHQTIGSTPDGRSRAGVNQVLPRLKFDQKSENASGMSGNDRERG